MKITGIIAEYNPFHNGHKYHLEQARAITGADYIIAVISGDFMQRGTPAIIDKYTRTRMALLNGADLVLELPLFYAAGSAEFFAMGAVSLLDKLGTVDSLCFGSECGDISILSETATILATEPDTYRKELQERLRRGFSFPKARSMALDACLPAFSAYTDAISSPNNILGIEYLKALLKRNSCIKPYTIKREGSGYHDKRLDFNRPHDTLPISSASAIRNSIADAEDLHLIIKHLPDSVYQLLKDSYHRNFPINSDDFSLLLKYRLLMDASKGYTGYLDITPDLSDKISKHLYSFESFEQFCGLLKSKDMTYSRISRSLLHILLGMTAKEHVKEDYIFYARILGFRKTSANLLGFIKNNTAIPLISKLANASSYLTPAGLDMLEKDIRAAHIYDSVVAGKFHTGFSNEYSRQLVIL